MSDQVAQIAERIRELREISGRTVEQVATLISIPVADYEALEAGTYDVPISVLLKLSSLYHVDTNTILTGEAPKMNIFALTRKGMGVDIDRRTHYHYTNLAYNFAHRKIEPLLVTPIVALPILLVLLMILLRPRKPRNSGGDIDEVL